MKVTKFALLNVVAAAFILVNGGKSFADQGSATLDRKPGANQLQTLLSHDVYVSVPVQVPYTVQVPYQVEETYTDYETQYVTEQVCHTTTVQQCANECTPVSNNVCESVPTAPNCHTVTECGTNALGEQICKDREVCDGGGSSQQCHTETTNQCAYRCTDVPQTQCGYESVPHQVPVEKTHLVTHYRDEERCCQTEYHSQFDHTDKLTVAINFPAGSELLAGEEEHIGVTLVNPLKGLVTLDLDDTVLGYKVASQSFAGGVTTINLALVPKYGPNDLGKDKIESLYLNIKAGQGVVTFKDRGVVPRVLSSYSVAIKDKATGKVLASGSAVSAASQDLSVPVGALAGDRDLTIELSVSRKGTVLTSPISVLATASWQYQFENPAQFSDANLIAATGLAGIGADAKVTIKDAAAESSYVDTAYDILIERTGTGFLGLGKSKLIEATVKRDQLKKNAAGDYEVSLVDDLKLAQADAVKYLVAGKGFQVTLQVTRTSDRLNNGQPIVMKKDGIKFKLK